MACDSALQVVRDNDNPRIRRQSLDSRCQRVRNLARDFLILFVVDPGHLQPARRNDSDFLRCSPVGVVEQRLVADAQPDELFADEPALFVAADDTRELHVGPKRTHVVSDICGPTDPVGFVIEADDGFFSS